MRRLIGSLAVVATVVAATVPAGAIAAGLRQIALSPAQVGPGYRMKAIPGGNAVRGQVTLDLCGFSFPSERLRLARLQVAYIHAGKGTVQLSNEVVLYRAGGAQQALHEVAHAASHCPRRPVRSTIAGVPALTYRIGMLTDRRLLPGSVALRVHVSGKYKGKKITVTAIGVYQAKGNVLSGVYTNGQGTFAAQLRLGLHAAEQSSRNLARLA